MRPASRPVLSPRLEQLRVGASWLRTWSARRWLVASATGVLSALVIGVPTGIVQTSLYTRMTPVTWWNYPVWTLSAVLIGLTAATYVRDRDAVPAGPDRSRRTIGAALLSTFAVGCPICNKLVVALLGVSGALTYWEPIQPVVGLLSIALLATGLAVRLRAAATCPAPRRAST